MKKKNLSLIVVGKRPPVFVALVESVLLEVELATRAERSRLLMS